MTLVIINDFVTDKRVTMLYLSDDFEPVITHWRSQDTLLRDLQYLSSFAGRTRWCDLEPVHFREMIAKNLQYIGKLPEAERLDEENPVVSSLNFLICTLIYCWEKRTDSQVDMVKINRVGDTDVSIEFSAEMKMDVSPLEKMKADTHSGISVIVDNT